MQKLDFIATTTFGLEAVVKREAANLGFSNISVSDGSVRFTGSVNTIAKANICLRSADRLLVVIGQFKALTFDELFEQTKALPWDIWIPKNGKFTVIGKSIRSQLFSVSDCQAIVKKAVVEKLKSKYHIDWFQETGAEYKIQVGLLNDNVTLTIDTTGSAGLHKRGYRQISVEAPLKETLAAALIDLSFWKSGKTLLDPTCGSGTIPIEAALIAKNIAPGLKRSFASEGWDNIMDKKIWDDEREMAYAKIDRNIKLDIKGSDIDSGAIEIAKQNAIKAGVDDCITFEVKPLEKVRLEGDYGVSIINPPYGQRLGEYEEVKKLYENMGRLFYSNKTWSTYVLTSCEEFEKLYGRKADKKRKLFNGNVKTDYYQFHGTKPIQKSMSL